ncbi:MAG TPA: hypothetical protein VJ747_17295, partial [Stellaceae bacterium]|nr:hypothetical protein [Stellaceae bacterium]
MLRAIKAVIPEPVRRLIRGPVPALSGHARGPNLALAHARALEYRFPALREFGLPLNDATADAILAFYNAYLPLLYAPARGAHLRTLLTALRSR